MEELKSAQDQELSLIGHYLQCTLTDTTAQTLVDSVFFFLGGGGAGIKPLNLLSVTLGFFSLEECRDWKRGWELWGGEGIRDGTTIAIESCL